MHEPHYVGGMTYFKKALAAVAAAVTIALGGGAASAFADTVVVHQGDTLSAIAAAHGTTYQHLAAINGISNPDVINVGQVLNTSGGGGGSVHPAVQYHQSSPVVPVQHHYSAPVVPVKHYSAPVQQSSGSSSGGGSESAAKAAVAQIESGGNPNAVNSSSGAVGEYQCLPSAHADCPAAGDAAGQSAWADHYVAQTYGSWSAALAHEHSSGWY